MSNLKELENKSIFIIREAKNKFSNRSVLSSFGKDSTVLLYLIRKAFYGKIPFKVIHIDTTFKFPEIYAFRDNLVKEWNIDLVIAKNEEALNNGIKCKKPNSFECCHQLKTIALQQCIEKNKFDVVLVGIRRDEHGVRNKEHYFSPRDKDFRWRTSKKSTNSKPDSGLVSTQDPEFSGWNIYATDFGKVDHVRCHPLLHWTEQEIWEYILQKKIKVNPLYFSKNGKRYRSIGCKLGTKPIKSKAKTVKEIIDEVKLKKTRERSGRSIDKEDLMEKLRSLGYM